MDYLPIALIEGQTVEYKVLGHWSEDEAAILQIKIIDGSDAFLGLVELTKEQFSLIKKIIDKSQLMRVKR